MPASGKTNTENRAAQTKARRKPATARAVRAAAANTSERVSGSAEDTMRETLHAATEGPRRMAEQVSQLFAVSGEQGEELTRRSAQSMEAVTQASAAVTRGIQDLSRELMTLTQDQIRRNVEALGTLARCRSFQELVTLQSELMRDNLQHTLEGARRIAEVSGRMAEDATQTMSRQARDNARRRVA